MYYKIGGRGFGNGEETDSGKQALGSQEVQG